MGWGCVVGVGDGGEVGWGVGGTDEDIQACRRENDWLHNYFLGKADQSELIVCAERLSLVFV